MSIHPNLAAGFVAVPKPRATAWGLILSGLRPIPRQTVKAALWEALDVAANVCALGTLLSAVALVALAFGGGR